MACCAIGKCGRRDELERGPGLVYIGATGAWRCYLCYVFPILWPQPKHPVDEDVATAATVENPIRDGLFDILTGKRKDPTWKKRRRAGPLWVPHDRRV
jgi:hypothetical protein